MNAEAMAARLKRLHEAAKAALGDVRRLAGDSLLYDMDVRAAVVAVTDVVDGCEEARTFLAKAMGRPKARPARMLD